MIRRIGQPFIACLTAIATSISVVGCASETATRQTSTPQIPIRAEPVGPPKNVSIAPGDVQRVDVHRKMVNVQTAFAPLGLIPYDNTSLPLVSPDGQFIATQTGAPPSIKTSIAEPDSPPCDATRIEIYRLVPGTTGKPALVATIEGPALLGRSIDQHGFLLESPRSDGARWIGRAAWETGAVTWLVEDEHCNAFASWGPDHRLVWSRRLVGHANFELVIRHGDNEWSMGETNEHWIVPTWAGQNDSLFAMHLLDKQLSAVHMIASSPLVASQSRRTRVLADNATIQVACQTLAGNANLADGPIPTVNQLVFFHPALGRSYVWRPLSRQWQAKYLNAGSIFAHVDRDEYALVSTNSALLLQNLNDAKEVVELLKGVRLVRTTSNRQWPYVLLSPRENEIDAVVMLLIQP